MARSWLTRTLAALGLAAVSAGAAGAQVFTPTYMSPRMTNDIGVYVGDSPRDPGDLAIEGIWRGGPLGLRVGFADGPDDALLVGGEFRNPIPLAGAPFGLAFTAGIQAAIGDADALGFQAGLTAGHTFLSPGFAFTPYIHPRIAFINGFGGDDELDLEVLADVGFDLGIAPNLILRFGANLGEGADWGFGFAWRR
ncbi:MAG TPA: hypothetical protein VGR37_12930 [Longimicrobiaceae bacterium]|nr:hypothetical protein [Longimicrobiaceae bacterium]